MEYPVYMDYNATTPVDKEVLDTMLPYLTTHFGNAASRSHAFGWKAADAIVDARARVARLIGATEKEIVFTSGATESVNLAIKGVYESYCFKGKHIITAQTEHKAVLDTFLHLEKQGAEITILPVDSNGHINLEELEKSIRQDTILISLMAANNETGVRFSLRDIADIARRRQVLFHSDATQAVGKVPVDVIDDGVDLLSFSAHKIYGPKGVGALYVRKKLDIAAQMDGGKHERGLRSGTLNVPAIVGMGKACEVGLRTLQEEYSRVALLRDRLEVGILKHLPFASVNGDVGHRLPNTTNISFGKIDGEQLLMSLNEIAVSNGSACNSASTEPSYVLKAMGLDDAAAYGSIRFSLGRMTSEVDVEDAIKHVYAVVSRMNRFTTVFENH